MASTLFYGLLLILAIAMLAAADEGDAASTGDAVSGRARVSELGYQRLCLTNLYKVGTPHHYPTPRVVSRYS